MEFLNQWIFKNKFILNKSGFPHFFSIAFHYIYELINLQKYNGQFRANIQKH